jgi:recombination protein RecR
VPGFLPNAVERLILELGKLPGVGRKTAQRLAFHLLKAPASDVEALASALRDLRQSVRLCADCFNLAESERCPICADPRRDRGLLCVVEEPSNVATLERTGSYRGLYHVLGGALSPLRDVGPSDLHVDELLERVRRGSFREVILATNANAEGEATAVYVARLLKGLGVRATRLATGLPAGADLEFTDELTLKRAFEGRRDY